MSEIERLQELVGAFASSREWDQFHTPRNLAMAMGGEVGELLAELQWIDDVAASRLTEACDLRDRVQSELADVFIYLLRFADVTDIDLYEAVRAKVELNESRYPVDLAKGRSDKYDRLSEPGTP